MVLKGINYGKLISGSYEFAVKAVTKSCMMSMLLDRTDFLLQRRMMYGELGT